MTTSGSLPCFWRLPAGSPEQQKEQIMTAIATIRVEFDGGNDCNIPSLGYGLGYGSYRINDEPVCEVSHGRPMSNNVAEIWTLIVALKELSERWSVSTSHNFHLKIIGDSKIALNRCHHAPNLFYKKKAASPDFIDACGCLREVLARFHSFETRWQPREASVATFGH